MSILNEDETGKKPAAITIGEDLSLLSVGELEDRIAACKEEIERIRTELAEKKSSMAAAAAIFKK